MTMKEARLLRRDGKCPFCLVRQRTLMPQRGRLCSPEQPLSVTWLTVPPALSLRQITPHQSCYQVIGHRFSYVTQFFNCGRRVFQYVRIPKARFDNLVDSHPVVISTHT